MPLILPSGKLLLQNSKLANLDQDKFDECCCEDVVPCSICNTGTTPGSMTLVMSGWHDRCAWNDVLGEYYWQYFTRWNGSFALTWAGGDSSYCAWNITLPSLYDGAPTATATFHMAIGTNATYIQIYWVIVFLKAYLTDLTGLIDCSGYDDSVTKTIGGNWDHCVTISDIDVTFRVYAS